MTRLASVPTEFLLDDLTWSLLIGSAVLLVAVAAVRISVRSGLPSLLIFLGIGLALGESGVGITFDSEELTQVLGYAALVLILAEGGLTTRYSSIRRSIAPAALISTVGVVVSVAVVAVAARFVLQLEWSVALPFTLAAVAGVTAGIRAADRLPARSLLRWFAALLVLVALFTGIRAVTGLVA